MRNILIATDFTADAERGLIRAAKLAKRHNATLTILHVVDSEPAERAKAEDTALARLDNLIRTHGELAGVAALAKVMTGNVAGSITAAAIETRARLIVLGARDQALMRSVLLGSTVERVVRNAQVPVLVANAEPEIPYRLCLAAVDFSDCSRNALQKALCLDRFTRGRVVVLHVFDVVAKGMLHYIGEHRDGIDGDVADIATTADHAMAAFLRHIDFGAAAHSPMLREGKAAPCILSVANELRPDLIVIGTHGRDSVARTFLGCVAEDVLLQARRDVLVVPDNG